MKLGDFGMSKVEHTARARAAPPLLFLPVPLLLSFLPFCFSLCRCRCAFICLPVCQRRLPSLSTAGSVKIYPHRIPAHSNHTTFSSFDTISALSLSVAAPPGFASPPPALSESPTPRRIHSHLSESSPSLSESSHSSSRPAPLLPSSLPASVSLILCFAGRGPNDTWVPAGHGEDVVTAKMWSR